MSIDLNMMLFRLQFYFSIGRNPSTMSLALTPEASSEILLSMQLGWDIPYMRPAKTSEPITQWDKFKSLSGS
jgi:hypothetical protein